MSKKIIAVAAAIILAAIAVVGGTLAWFTDKGAATNVLTTGKVNVTLDETVDEDAEANEDGGYDFSIMPGDEITKKPYLTLGTDSEDAYVRMKFTVTSTGAAAGDKATVEAGVTGVVAAAIAKDWVKSGDWYYYKDVLSDATSRLYFIDKDLVFAGANFGNIYQGVEFKILFDAEATQVANQPIEGDITADKLALLTGWPS